MNYKLRGLVAASITGALMLGVAQQASADSTMDIVNALVAKGVLTEEEGALLTKGREMESASQAKAMKKATKLSVSDAIDNATVYGDMRVRYEDRKGESDTGREQDRSRARYKLTLGVKTSSDKFYTDLALAMGGQGRSDNATFGSGTNGSNTKETAYIKRAMIGWKATDWLTLEAGRMANPLYTTPMVWDGDLTLEGLNEQAKFKFGDTNVFLTAVQSQYLGDTRKYSGTDTTVDRASNWLMAFQAGAEMPLSENVKGKAAVTYTTYSNNKTSGIFAPAVGNGNGLGANVVGTNNINTIEIPFEVNYKTNGALKYSLFGDYVTNLDGSDRAKEACAVTPAICGTGTDDKAWMLGAAISSQADKKVAKGDWSARIWYQDVGVYSVDPNAVDSDFFDSKVNMKGVVLKTQYNIQENVFVNFAAGHGTRKNNRIATAGVAGDLGYNLKDMDLYQLDLTYRF